MKKFVLAIVLALTAAVAIARVPPPLGYLEAQTPAAWPEAYPAQGAQCSLYINGVLTLSAVANAAGVCQFGYVHAIATYTIVAHQVTNYTHPTGVTASGSVTLTTPSNQSVLVVLQ